MAFSFSGEFCELIIRESSGAKLETFKWSLDNKQLERKIFSIIKNKYGIFAIEKRDRDLDWLKE